MTFLQIAITSAENDLTLKQFRLGGFAMMQIAFYCFQPLVLKWKGLGPWTYRWRSIIGILSIIMYDNVAIIRPRRGNEITFQGEHIKCFEMIVQIPSFFHNVTMVFDNNPITNGMMRNRYYRTHIRDSFNIRATLKKRLRNAIIILTKIERKKYRILTTKKEFVWSIIKYAGFFLNEKESIVWKYLRVLKSIDLHEDFFTSANVNDFSNWIRGNISFRQCQISNSKQYAD